MTKIFVDALVPEARALFCRHLQFRFWDEEWGQLKNRLNEERASLAGLQAGKISDLSWMRVICMAIPVDKAVTAW